MTKNRRALIFSVIFTIIVVGVLLTSYYEKQSRRAVDYASFVDALQADGMSVKSAGKLPVDFFSVEGQALIIKDQFLVVVFEYPDAASAEADASKVSPDGRSVGTIKPSFGFTPHFYKSGRLIAVYVGDDKGATKILESVLGPQFAGG